jgi:hypothetical protein
MTVTLAKELGLDIDGRILDTFALTFIENARARAEELSDF